MALRIHRLAQLLGADFHQIERVHLSALCSQSVAEGADLDFKKENAYVKDNDGLDELAKDVTAMANGRGGLIIVGVEDDAQGSAASLKPIVISDADCNKLNEALRRRVSPLLPNDFEIRTVVDDPADPGLGYLLIGIPRSPMAPHVVRGVGGKGLHRFGFARRIGRVTGWLDESEVAAMYRDRFQQAEQHVARVHRQLQNDSGWLAESSDSRLSLTLSLVPGVGAERRIDRMFIGELRTFLGALANSEESPSAKLPRALLSSPPHIRRGRMKVEGFGIDVVWHADGGVTAQVDLSAPDNHSADVPVLNLTRLEYHILCALHLACSYAEWAGAYGDVDVMACTSSPPTVHLDRSPLNGSARYVPGVPISSDAGEPCHHVGYLEALATDSAQLRSVAMRIAADLLADYGVYELTLIRPSCEVRSERLAASERVRIEAWLARVPGDGGVADFV
ncbi:AlbA family DNA-binding domain-containing protein [Nocardia sp. NPDC003999]